MTDAKILVVDDEQLIRWSIRERLRAQNWEVLEAASLAEAMVQLSGGVDVVLLDNRLPDGSGLDAIPAIHRQSPDTIIIMLTATNSVEAAVAAMHAGAWHYLTKPGNFDELIVKIRHALETMHLRRDVQTLREVVAAPWGHDTIVGQSQAVQAVRAMLTKVARTPASTVLLTGESGTGKDLAAKVIHYNSARANKPFMNITCSALQETLLESELFGHEKGAFTDARAQKKGLLELAAGGTVFLDEIGEMSLGLQSKVLRFLEEKTFKRVGGAQDVSIDVRVIAATNRDLDADVAAGRFREDLFYRLRVLPVELPPLRDRPGDVQVLIDFFLKRFAQEFKKPVRGVSDHALHVLAQRQWPGNIRELRNAVERAVLLADAEELTLEDFLLTPTRATHSQPQAIVLPEEGLDMDALQDELVRQALARTSGNQTRAAQLLGLSRDQIRYRLERMAGAVAQG